MRVFFKASGSWGSEGLFGQSFSVAPPIQALKGIPCLGSFSVVWHIRHIEGTPLLGSYSVDWCIRHLKGHPGWAPSLLFGASVTKGALWRGSYSVVQCVRRLMCQSLYCSAADAGAGVRGETGYGDGSTHYA